MFFPTFKAMISAQHMIDLDSPPRNDIQPKQKELKNRRLTGKQRRSAPNKMASNRTSPEALMLWKTKDGREKYESFDIHLFYVWCIEGRISIRMVQKSKHKRQKGRKQEHEQCVEGNISMCSRVKRCVGSFQGSTMKLVVMRSFHLQQIHYNKLKSTLLYVS